MYFQMDQMVGFGVQYLIIPHSREKGRDLTQSYDKSILTENSKSKVTKITTKIKYNDCRLT